FDLDHVRAQVREELRTERPREQPAEVQHDDAVERPGHAGRKGVARLRVLPKLETSTTTLKGARALVIVLAKRAQGADASAGPRGLAAVSVLADAYALRI